MQLYNLINRREIVNFSEAARRGLGSRQGLFFPQDIPQIVDVEKLLQEPFVERSVDILSAWIGTEISRDELKVCTDAAFNFPVPVTQIDSGTWSLELYHGPTLAFKDFGARFLAQIMARFCKGQRLTVLTATSGDTGAAVAHAFYGVPGTAAVVLYPKNRISILQERLFCTLGGNVTTFAVDGDFDACQSLVKQAFDDPELTDLGLNSANSINIARLLAQICYYFEAVAQIPAADRAELVVGVPCGNFGDLTAGLMAMAMGLPVKRFVAATNANDTVPRFLTTRTWEPRPTVHTLSNSMDVSQPNNWPRILELCNRMGWGLSSLQAEALDDGETRAAMRNLWRMGYLSEPHGAVAWKAMTNSLRHGERGIFLSTAHPAKFAETVESVLHTRVTLPPALSERADLPLLSRNLSADYQTLKEALQAMI